MCHGNIIQRHILKLNKLRKMKLSKANETNFIFPHIKHVRYQQIIITILIKT